MKAHTIGFRILAVGLFVTILTFQVLNYIQTKEASSALKQEQLAMAHARAPDAFNQEDVEEEIQRKVEDISFHYYNKVARMANFQKQKPWTIERQQEEGMGVISRQFVDNNSLMVVYVKQNRMGLDHQQHINNLQKHYKGVDLYQYQSEYDTDKLGIKQLMYRLTDFICAWDISMHIYFPMSESLNTFVNADTHEYSTDWDARDQNWMQQPWCRDRCLQIHPNKVKLFKSFVENLV